MYKIIFIFIGIFILMYLFMVIYKIQCKYIGSNKICSRKQKSAKGI